MIDFCAGIAPEYKMRGLTDKWILRQVAARILPKRIANRPKTMFRACMSGIFLGPNRPPWVDQLLSPESLRSTGYFDPAAVARQRGTASVDPTDHPGAVRLRRRAHQRRVNPTLASSLLRWSLRPSNLASSSPPAQRTPEEPGRRAQRGKTLMGSPHPGYDDRGSAFPRPSSIVLYSAFGDPAGRENLRWRLSA